METKLTLGERLNDLRKAKHLTMEELAEKTGLSRSAIGKYEADYGLDMSPFALAKLAEFFGVSADYLLGLTDTKNHPGTELSALHLSDEMISLLKEGRINTRLLCEMATHKDFGALLADMEVYVDRIASSQVKTLNSSVDAVRKMILEKYNPDEDDPRMKTLEAAHIDEDEYFAYRVHEDIDRIMKDIRKDHVSDKTTADDNSLAESIRKNIEEISALPGSPQEKQAILFCRQLGIDYKKLSTEEFLTLVDVLKKSKLLKSPVSQRGKTLKKMTRKKQ